MPRKRFSSEQIIAKLRQIEVQPAQGTRRLVADLSLEKRILKDISISRRPEPGRVRRFRAASVRVTFGTGCFSGCLPRGLLGVFFAFLEGLRTFAPNSHDTIYHRKRQAI